MLRGPLLYADPRQRLNGANDVCRRLAADDKCKLAGGLAGYVERCATLQRRFPELRVNEFEQHHLDQFLRFDAHDKPRVIGQPGWREGTVNAYVNAFTYVFAWALKHDLAQHDPAAKLREDWGQKRIVHREGIWLSATETSTLVERLVGDDVVELRNRVLLQILVGAGLREAEMASLRWEQLATIADPRSRIRVYGKGKKYRDVLPLPAVRSAVVEWRRVHVALRGAEPAPSDPVIPATKAVGVDRYQFRRELRWTTALGKDGINGVVQAAALRIGRPELRPHDLRRTFAGFLDDSGISLRGIREQLGHKDLSTTEIYLSNNPGRLVDEFAKAGLT